MDHVRQRDDEAGQEQAVIQRTGSASKWMESEGDDREAGNGVTIEVLCVWIVEPVQVKHEQRRRRPDQDGAEDGGVALGKICAWPLARSGSSDFRCSHFRLR